MDMINIKCQILFIDEYDKYNNVKYVLKEPHLTIKNVVLK